MNEVSYGQSPILVSTSTFEVKIADSLHEIEAALRLRFEVFNLEMKEGLESSFEAGFDSDVYDTFCDHLIVKEKSSGSVVGTYRLLCQSKAEQHIGFYSENEFDLSLLKRNTGRSLELGRSCVAKEFRSIAVINLLWSGIARYIEKEGITHLFGCASLHSTDPHHLAPAYYYLIHNHLAPKEFWVTPHIHCRIDFSNFNIEESVHPAPFSSLPPLMKGYLRLGAVICGEPAVDREFGTTDFLILVDTAKITERYRDHYVKIEKVA
ncbi:MAG: GNAT family N-acyltransferase [Bacteroidota bacterium]